MGRREHVVQEEAGETRPTNDAEAVGVIGGIALAHIFLCEKENDLAAKQ